MEDNQLICFEEGKKFLGNDHVTFLKRFYEINLDVSINSLKTSYSRRLIRSKEKRTFLKRNKLLYWSASM